ncbi:MAG: histidine phosphatase family protein [Clostridia bacterium]|nr:histidine phosphatase family protein [Clostridia bacterium]
MQEKLIYLIRHAQPDYPDGVRMCLGQKTNLPLSTYGFKQAKALSRLLEHAPIEAVYTSPLLRARQTAEAIAGRCRPLHVLDALIELDGGEWDGLTFDQLRSHYPQYFGQGRRASCPPGGESDKDGLARAHAALAYIAAHTQSCAAAVAHSGINRLLLCDLCGLPFSEKKQVSQGFAAVSTLAYQNGVWTVKAISVPPQGE